MTRPRAPAIPCGIPRLHVLGTKKNPGRPLAMSHAGWSALWGRSGSYISNRCGDHSGEEWIDRLWAERDGIRRLFVRLRLLGVANPARAVAEEVVRSAGGGIPLQAGQLPFKNATSLATNALRYAANAASAMRDRAKASIGARFPETSKPRVAGSNPAERAAAR
jgi:hypothetical protein